MWVIETTDTFDEWFDALDDTDRANVLASMMVLRDRGPMLSRPYADTLTVHPTAKKSFRAGNKTWGRERFYEVMIPIADREFAAHLDKLKKE
ncbi:diaminopimelate decarboxylase [Klebsiella pneumoniae]|uniref:diaminopimelate decarboxylase n=1 Tax=Klebsiella pneumoniae TaxID=573 RepID=UPI000F1B4750|nr:diaminopimelate decarboxylase [Klebsiella pneumoniae]VCV93085.1 hypothetical protein BANRA_05108 [Klebsiella pneumoniae]